MTRTSHTLSSFFFLLLAIVSTSAQQSQPVQMASLRPDPELRWQRVSPTAQQPDGPVLYQLVFNASGMPGTVPAFDTNPRHLTNSPITISSGDVFIAGLKISGGSGIISFADGQTFPGSGLPDLVGEVTGPPGATVVRNAVSAAAPKAIVRRDGSGSFSAGSITLGGVLDLPNTASPSVGVLTLGGTPFLHNYGTANTFVGSSAGNLVMTGSQNAAFGTRALSSNTTGFSNAAFGYNALNSNTTGGDNAAFGHSALVSNTTGGGNAALGPNALFSNTTGSENAAFGDGALGQNKTGFANAAFGPAALQNLVNGSGNIAIGGGAGANFTGSESNNIDIGNVGTAGESGVIRIGRNTAYTAAFMAGISGSTSASGVNVFVNTDGQLGTLTSSRRFKQDIADLGAESDILMKLRPVAFYYKPELDSTHTRQYGLVAEEVAQIAPGLVVFDKDSRPQTVRYHFVTAMLLNEVQKQRRLIEAQQEQMEALRQHNSEIQQQLKAVLLRLEAMEKSGRQSNTPEVATLVK